MMGDRPAGEGRIGILISGRGSNMLAITDACAGGDIPARVVVIVSNEPTASGLAAAQGRGIPTVTIDHRESPDRKTHDKRTVAVMREHGVDLVCLAGYMRLLGPDFIAAFQGRIMNIHPSLLPSFPGLHAQRQALEHGVRVSGVTVHYVNEGLDSGPIILQRAVPVEPGDTEETLSARILEQEHLIYPEAIRLFFE